MLSYRPEEATAHVLLNPWVGAGGACGLPRR